MGIVISVSALFLHDLINYVYFIVANPGKGGKFNETMQKMWLCLKRNSWFLQ